MGSQGIAGSDGDPVSPTSFTARDYEAKPMNIKICAIFRVHQVILALPDSVDTKAIKYVHITNTYKTYLY